ncbi:MAG TPA: SigE family RNA polymerase sigma factor [Acidimicrobiales bacterium]
MNALPDPAEAYTAEDNVVPLRIVRSHDEEVRAAVVDLYTHHLTGLVRLGTLLIGDRHAAEDLAHEAFVRLYRSWDRIDDPAKAMPYLRTTMVNLARGRHRHSLVALKHEEAPPRDAASAEDVALGRVSRGAVMAALHALPERQRECLVLRHYLRMTEGEIAGVLGVSVGSVRTHTKRGLATLERVLGGQR